MKIKCLQQNKENKVTLSLGQTHLLWLLQLEYEWVSNLKSGPSNCLKINASCCVKNLRFMTKNALFRYFGEQIEKDIAIFAISALKVESFMQNVRNFNLGSKLTSLDWRLKNYWHISNQHPRICQNEKFCAKIKVLKGTLKQIWKPANIFVLIWK